LGYGEAKPDESFVKIGVGTIRKPDEPRFRPFNTYEILDPGEWTVIKGADWIEFTQKLSGVSGYAYIYRKRLRLRGHKLILEHHLKNTGRKTIETSVYEHDFFMLDGQPSGPDTVVSFAFAPRAVDGLRGLAEIRGKEFKYLKELEKGQTVETLLEGFGGAARDYDIRIENRKTGAGVRQTGDRPLTKMLLWSIRTTVCPEAFIDLKIAPGQEGDWRIAYQFYTSSPR
jgi:hypothetical protein